MGCDFESAAYNGDGVTLTTIKMFKLYSLLYTVANLSVTDRGVGATQKVGVYMGARRKISRVAQNNPHLKMSTILFRRAEDTNENLRAFLRRFRPN